MNNRKRPPNVASIHFQKTIFPKSIVAEVSIKALGRGIAIISFLFHDFVLQCWAIIKLKRTYFSGSKILSKNIIQKYLSKGMNQ